MARLQINNVGSWWRRKLSNFVRYANLNRFFTCKREVLIITQFDPLFVGKPKVASEYSLGTSVIYHQTLCDVLKSSGACRLWELDTAPVKGECCMCAGLASLCPQVSQGSY